MDYEKFFALYPKLLPYREQVTLLGEDPYIQTDLGQVGEYELNKELSRSTVSPRLTTKKFLVIQSGCDTYCTFCLTIYRRGAHRSRSLEEIIEEVEEFTAAGGQEVVIT
ncbi:MAG: radical SAM protein [bacterium]|nr:radical SAM protein [bacterium]